MTNDIISHPTSDAFRENWFLRAGAKLWNFTSIFKLLVEPVYIGFAHLTSCITLLIHVRSHLSFNKLSRISRWSFFHTPRVNHFRFSTVRILTFCVNKTRVCLCGIIIISQSLVLWSLSCLLDQVFSCDHAWIFQVISSNVFKRWDWSCICHAIILTESSGLFWNSSWLHVLIIFQAKKLYN